MNHPLVACATALGLVLAVGPAHAQAGSYPPADSPPSDNKPPDNQQGGYAPATPNQGGNHGAAGDDDDDDDDDGGGGGSASDLLPPSTRPFFFVAGVGPSFFGLANGKRKGKGFKTGTISRFKLALDIGYHLSGDAEGPAIGATIEQSFDNQFYIFNPAFKFWWDIHITDMAIYIAPFGKAGYALAACSGCSAHAFNLGAGVEGRVVFLDRWMAFLRPVQLDTYIGDFNGTTFLFNYDVLIGGGVTF